MLKPGNIVYVRVLEKSGNCYKVATDRNRHTGVLFVKDLSDKGETGRTPPMDIYFRVMVSRNRASRNEYLFEQTPVIWHDINPSPAIIYSPKPLLCRVELVKPNECTLIILDKNLSSGEYHIEGRLKIEHAQQAMQEFAARMNYVNKVISLEDILWEGDLVYACCIEIKNMDLYLELSLDKWLSMRKTLTTVNPEQENIYKDSIIDDWQEEGARIQKRAEQIRKKIRRIVYLDDSQQACTIIENYGKTLDFHIDTYLKSSDLLAALRSNPHYYQAGIFDYHLSGDDPIPDGIEVAMRAHDINPDLPIVVISAYFNAQQNLIKEDLSRKLIYGPYPRFGTGEMGLLNYLEIAAGIESYHLHEETAIKEKSVESPKRNITLEKKIGETVKENLSLCEKAKDLYIWGFSPGSSIPRCYYYRGQAIKNQDLKILDTSFFLQLLHEQKEYWLADKHNITNVPGVETLIQILGFKSIFCIPIIVHSNEKFFLLLTGNTPHFLNENEKEQARRLSLLLTLSIQRHFDMEPLMINFQTYSLGMIIEGLAHDLNHKMWNLEVSLNDIKAAYGKKNLNPDELIQKLIPIQDILIETKTFTSQISKIQTKNYATEPLSDLLGTVQANMQSFAARKNTRILVDKNIPFVNIPGGELAIIIFNLLHNAIRYGHPTEGATGYVVISAILNQNKSVRIRIQDKGIGIHRAHMERIFERGFSAHGGSGLGLAICRNITESIGGSLEVENSVLYGGTTFILDLPIPEV